MELAEHSSLRKPLTTLVACALLVLLALAGLPGLSATNDYTAFFGPDNPDLQAHQAFTHEFELSDTLIFAIEARSGDLLTAQNLRALEQLTDAASDIPHAYRVTSLATFQHGTVTGDDISFAPLIPDTAMTAADVQRIGRIARSEAELVDRAISADGQVAGLFVSTTFPDSDRQAATAEVAKAALQFIDDAHAQYPALRLRVTGVTMLDHTLGEVMRADIVLLAPIALLFVLVGTLLFFRAVLPAVITLGVVGLSVMAAMGVGGWLGIVLTDVSIASMLCIMTLAVADCLHLFVTYYRALAADNDARRAITTALRVNLEPISITSITTAIGFLALNASEAPPFRDLGNIVAVGVGFAWLLSIAAVPACLWLLGAQPAKKPSLPPAGTQAMARLGAWVVRRRRLLLPTAGTVLLVCCAGVAMNRFGDNYVEYFPPDNEFRQATEFVNSRLSGMQVIEYAVDSGQPGGALEPAFLRRLERFRTWLEAQPEVRSVAAPTDLFKRLNRAFHSDDPAYNRIPKSRELAAQYLLFYELSLPAGLSINNMLSADRARTRLTVLVDANTDTGELVALERRASAWLAAELPAIQATGSGPSLMFAKVSKRNFKAMVVGVLVAIALIAVILIAVFRSVGLGLLSMIPNLLPGVAAYGLWGLTVGKLDMSLSVVGSLSLGILVDDTVHFLSKYQRARKELGFDSAAAVQEAFSTVGSALLATSTILVAGFALFALSDFQMVQHLGLLTAGAISLALFCDFFFLPPLVMACDRPRQTPNAPGTPGVPRPEQSLSG